MDGWLDSICCIQINHIKGLSKPVRQLCLANTLCIQYFLYSVHTCTILFNECKNTKFYLVNERLAGNNSLPLHRITNYVGMVIEYDNSKEVKCYRDFVLNTDNRSASRAFSKVFGVNLMEPAKKLHDRLKRYVSAGAYNIVFGQTDNRIELKQGCGKNEPLILKVRVGRGRENSLTT